MIKEIIKMKKITLSLFIVILLSLMVSGIASAAENPSGNPHLPPVGGGRLNFGEITELAVDQFTIETRASSTASNTLPSESLLSPVASISLW